MDRKTHPYRKAYNELKTTVDNAYSKAIKNEKTYQLANADDAEDIMGCAETIEYSSSGFYHTHIDVGYIISIDQHGIYILTEECEKTIIPYSCLYSLWDKITVVEMLDGY